MGRGRAKAKQTKVARELKYFSPNTDYSALERELHAKSEHHFDSAEDDQYGDYADRYSDSDDDDDGGDSRWASVGR
ncbi:DUF3073 domain-containing protein [Arsenicicoccus piscis]|uniref:DUF3073 domain-containing protein n=1 Tax=Arsenicicoccus piscis TaxID=673954 RepID=UPI001F4CAE2A|nr:DUF3073 domain-containing protein [Arsenicicoccus piscis]MCH8626249.1 DUF3073 domain-containing protein [Arsenicicoccus piscis]